MIFLIILLVLSPLLLGITRLFNKRDIPLYNYFLGFFVPFQLLLSPLTIAKSINFNSYKIIAIILLVVIIISFITYNYFIYRKDKHKLNWKDLYKHLIIFGLVCVALIFILFTWYSSTKTNNDLNYYLNISKNFQYSIFSPGVDITINGSNLIGVTSNPYLVPQMYYAYSVFFSSNLAIGYNLVNPLIYIILMCYIADSLIDFQFKNIKLIYRTLVLITITFASLSSLYLNVTSGNLAIQSLVLLLFIINAMRIKDNSVWNYVPFIALSFFSSTGLLNSLIPIIVISIVKIFRNGLSSLIYSVPVLLTSVYANVVVFTQILKSSKLIIAGSYVLLFLCFVCYFVFYYVTNRKQINKYISVKNEFLTSKLWVLGIILFFIVTIILTSVNNLYIYGNNGEVYFNTSFTYLYIIAMLIVFAIWLIDIFKNKKNNYLCLLFVLVNFLSTIEFIASSVIIYSASSWRLIYLTIGMGNIPDTILLIFLLLVLFITQILKLQKSSKKDKMISMFKHHKMGYVSASILTILTSAMTMTASYTSIFNVENINQSFAKDVEYNLNFATNKDIKLLNSIDFQNWEKTYITDMSIYQYLNKATDLTSFINYNGANNICLSYHWNYYNFYYGIDYYNEINPNQKMDKTPESLIQGINQIINNLPSWGLQNRNKTQITKLDYIILNKYTPYFSNLYNQYSRIFKNVTEGEAIVVLGR